MLSDPQIVAKYFGPYANRVTVIGDIATVDGFAFVVEQDTESLRVLSHPNTPEFDKSAMTPERFAWHCVAWLKVRHFNSGADIIDKARTGEIYDEDYFMRRGGGGPYVGYPITDYGADLRKGFAVLAREIMERFAPKRMLDLGCATGELVKLLQERGVSASGLDISEWCVKNAVTHDVFQGSALAMPFESDRFDVVISQDVMEHIHPDDLAIALSEQVRVTRNGGHLCHFIPFYPQFESPKQIDVHLTNASFSWWIKKFREIPNIDIVQVAPEINQWDNSGGILSRYFVFEVQKIR